MIVGCSHTGTDSPAWSGLVWSGGVGVGRWGGCGCGGLIGRVVWTVGWFLPAVPHPVVVWEVVVNKDFGMPSHRDGFPGVVTGLVWSGGVGVGRWGGSSCGGLIGRVVWTVGWFLPAIPHPVVVWEVVVNKDCGMWSHRDGFPGVVCTGLVWSGLVGSGCGTHDSSKCENALALPQNSIILELQLFFACMYCRVRCLHAVSRPHTSIQNPCRRAAMSPDFPSPSCNHCKKWWGLTELPVRGCDV